MKIKVIRSENCTRGLNTKSGKPHHSYEPVYSLEHNHIKIGERKVLNPYPYKSYEFLSGQWLNREYYVDLSVNFVNFDGVSNPSQITITGESGFYDAILWLKFSNWYNKLRDIMAWVGGIVGTILSIKELFI